MLLSRSTLGFFLATALALPLTSGCGSESSTTGADEGEEATSSGSGSSTNGDDTTATSTDTTATSTDTTATSTDTTTDDTGATDDTGTDTSSFVMSDQGAGCGTECDIWNPTECAEGEKCTSVACEIGSNAWDSNVCRPIMGDKTEGDECDQMGSGLDGNDDCGAGLMCWDANPDTGLGTCIAFCIGSPDSPSCGDTSKLCAVANDGTLPICLDKCDPLAFDCPQSDDLCIPNPGEPGFVCVLDASGGMSPYGTPCNGPNEDDNSCNQGLICIPAEAVPEPTCTGGVGCCSPICDLTGPNQCPGADQGQTCEPWFETPVPGYEDVGICTIAL